MQCPKCQNEAKKHGRDRKGNKWYKCHSCLITFTEPQDKPLDDMRLPMDKALLVLNLLAEGNSIRSTERITGVHRDTIMNLLVTVGAKCEVFLDERIQAVPVKDVQADEIWTFVEMKEKTRSWPR
jgi:transposase-like protein